MDVTLLRIIVTVLSFFVFIGIWTWTWQRRNKPGFDEAAMLPFQQD